jgi:c(7)-type cytochrome triheme protein
MESAIPRPAKVWAAVALALVLRALPVGAEPPLRLPPDVTYDGADGSPGPVVFSHDSHVLFAEHNCTVCHPGAFSILHPAGRITHEEMDAGKKCGICHDGKGASGVQDACDSCHKEAPAP